MERHAYAKLNLTLGVVGTRADGYHLLSSVFHAIDLYDTLTVTKGAEGLQLTCEPHFMPHEDNLVLRAASAFARAAGRRLDCHIHVQKRIPLCAGLGGGSADAGTVLRMLYALYPGAVSAPRLLQIAATLGADIPFALYGGTQHAQGIGDILTPIACAKPLHFVLLKPRQGLVTKDVFARYDHLSAATQPNHAAAMTALALGDVHALAAALQNVLQTPAQSLVPQIGYLCDRLLQGGALCACMTGSGSAVFGLFESAQAARRAEAQLRGEAPLCVYVQSAPAAMPLPHIGRAKKGLT